MSDTVVVQTTFNRGGYNELTRSPTGDLAKYLHERGRRLVFLARQQVGKDTGELAASIGYSVNTYGGFPTLHVFARSSHAFMHHEGTRPHLITPQHGRYLRFRAGGKIVYARVVKHPGTRPNRFLTDHLRTIVKT